MTTAATAIGPWEAEICVVKGATRSSGERRALSREVARGSWRRLGPGMYARSAEFDGLPPESQHVVRMRALAGRADHPIVFSHWSAAVLHRLPVLRARLDRVHAVVSVEAERHSRAIAQHVFPLVPREIVEFAGLLATNEARTVIDLAGATPLDEGVIAADAALRRGLPRELLERAVELAGARRAATRIADAVAFAHPGGESAAESRTRVTAFRLGVEVPQLQRRFVLSDGSVVYADAWFPAADAVLEVDGLVKYLDPAIATRGAGLAVVREKYREDDLRRLVRAFGRSGWAQSDSSVLLRPILAGIGVTPTSPPTSFAEYCAAALTARPRRT